MRYSRSTVTIRRVVIAAAFLLPTLLLASNSLDADSKVQPGVIRGPSERDPQTLGSLRLAMPSPPATIQPSVTPTRTSTYTPTDTPLPNVPTSVPDPTATLTPTTVPPTPTSTPEPIANRFVIPSVGIRAVVQTQGVDSNLVMEVPDDPMQVAWYDFTAAPGTSGNTVFAGHVDHIRVGRAAFWNLRHVRIGDIMEYHSIDGRILRYKVTRIATQNANDPANDVIAPTVVETMTVITCTGSFDRSSSSYSQRLIVQATRQMP